MSGLKVVDDKTFTITLKKPESDFPLRLGYSAYFPVPDAAYGADGKITKEYGEKPDRQRAVHAEQDRVGAQQADRDGAEPRLHGFPQAEERGLTFKFYTSPDAAYSDVQAGNLDVLDEVPPSACRFWRRTTRQVVQRGRLDLLVHHHPGAPRATSTARRATCVARPSRRRSTVRRSARRSSSVPHAGQGLHVAGARRLDRPGRGQRGAGPRRHQGEAAGPMPTTSTSGTASSSSPTTPTAPATRSTPRRWPTSSRTPGHRRLGEGVPDVRRAPQGRHRAHHQDRVPHRLAGRLPVDAQLPRTDLRHGCRIE